MMGLIITRAERSGVRHPRPALYHTWGIRKPSQLLWSGSHEGFDSERVTCTHTRHYSTQGEVMYFVYYLIALVVAIMAAIVMLRVLQII